MYTAVVLYTHVYTRHDTRARQNYHFSVRVGPALDPDFPILELKTFPHMCGTYPADKYCGSWPRQPIPARPAFSIGFPPQTPPGWPGPTQEYRMGILVPFSRVLLYSAGTGSPVSSPVLCMVGTGRGTLRRFVLPEKRNFFSKAFRYSIKLDEL